MKKSIPLKSAAVLAALLMSQASHAVELDIKPGMWQFTTTTTSPMQPNPVTDTQEQCVSADDTFDPAATIQAQMAQMGAMCSIDVQDDTSTSYAADINCPLPGGAGTMSGRIAFETSGESASSTVNMNMNMGGQQMEMKSNSEATWMGSCD